MATIGNNELHLWCTTIHGFSRQDELHFLSVLSHEERRRHAHFAFQHHRDAFLTTRILARSVLARYTRTTPEQLRFRTGPYGKPRLRSPMGIGFNLSNSSSMVVCLVGMNHMIGVDCEPFSRAEEILELSQEFLTGPELEEVFSLHPEKQAERALALWTLKESYLKALGVGLTETPMNFAFLYGTGPVPRLHCKSLFKGNARNWQFIALEHDRHRISIAMPSSSPARLSILETDLYANTPSMISGRLMPFDADTTVATGFTTALKHAITALMPKGTGIAG